MIRFDADLNPTLIAAQLAGRRRVLFVGPPGSGKSTLAGRVAEVFSQQGMLCACVGADPGSPAFGVPGAVCLGRWDAQSWVCTDLEPLCSLDAARFRLPLIQALGRLMKRAPEYLILIDGPGVFRGAPAAELLDGFVVSAGIDGVVALQRHADAVAVEEELRALRLFVVRVCAAAVARRPAKSARDRRRTELWDRYLEQSSEYRIDLNEMASTGTPPPRDAPSPWAGRQVAFLDGQRCVAFGEALELDGQTLVTKLRGDPQGAKTILIRDAVRHRNGLLRTAEAVRGSTTISPPPDMSGTYLHAPAEPRPAARVGSATAMLVNGIFGDPLLHIRLQHQRRSLLFDLGEATRLPARIAHQVTDVFITHSHVDHIGGFIWLLRSRIGNLPGCRIFGPPGLADNIMGFVRGIHWDRVGERAPRFEIFELHEQKIYRYRVQAGIAQPQIVGDELTSEGILLRDSAFQVRAMTLDHGTPVLAFAMELRFDVRPGLKLVYATDLADTIENRTRLQKLAQGAHTFFCESPFCDADSEQAARTGHLTTKACGEIATASHVEKLIPFHFSRRYQDEPERVYGEVSTRCTRTVVPRHLLRQL